MYQTSTFKFKNAEHGAKLFKGEEKGFIYTRLGNPTVEAMEEAIAELEGGYKAIGCASGMAAVHTLIAGMVKSGDHIVCSESVYGATSVLLSTIMPEFGVETTFVDSSEIEQVKNAIKPNTRMIYIETPGNPTLAITDLAAVEKIAKEKGIYFAIDNTFMSPILQKPFEFGADFIIHSMTKYLNGHADVVAGIIVVKTPEHYAILRKMSNHFGGVIDPFNSFLVHRGLKTLSLRVLRQQENAQKIAEFLENHPKIDNIQFPGLPSHPQYELAKRQQKGSGSMISIELKGGYEAGTKLMDNVKLFQLAVS
ncbi:MAG TPA: aminotransferase class I/II-fold pyridoxal phosphate-dependent enzyme, partial [Bacteroidota bacterium]|nr:aminotransferase class I/II-fold pyridoxal phosphate-dependent enzyme [Bacteroidota bacterium]